MDGKKGIRGLRGIRGPSNTKKGQTNLVVSKDGFLIPTSIEEVKTPVEDIEEETVDKTSRIETSYVKKQRIEPNYKIPPKKNNSVIIVNNPENKSGYTY